MHSLDWWVKRWTLAGLLDVTCAEPLPHGRAIMQHYVDRYRDDPAEAEFVKLMQAQDLVGSYRMVGVRTERAAFVESEDADVAY